MSDWRLPETYNSHGLVYKVDSCNSSEADLVYQSGLDSSLDSSFEKTLPTLFMATANGLHPSLVTNMFSKSSEHLIQFLTGVFTHGLKTGQLESCLLLVKQFNHHKSYSKAIVKSVDNLTKSIVSAGMIDNLGTLIIELFEMLDKMMSTGKALFVTVIVDTLVKWVSPREDKKREITMAINAMKIISRTGPAIGQTTLSGYKLVYSQVRAGLVGDCLGAETRAVLLDTVVIMGRQVTRGGATRFLVDEHQENNAADNEDSPVDIKENRADENEDLPEVNENISVDDEDLPVDSEENDVDENKDNATSQNRAKVNQIDLEKMEPEVMPASKEKSMLYEAGFVCSFSADVDNIKLAREKKPDDEAGTGKKNKEVELISPAMFEKPASQELSNGKDRDGHVLGHLVSTITEMTYPVFNKSTIGRDTACSITLPGKEVSRLHARVQCSDGGISIESMSKTNKIRINSSTIEKEAILRDEDRVQVGREVFIWQREGVKPCDITKDTMWGEIECSDNHIESDKFEVDVEVVKEVALSIIQDHVELEEEVYSDTDSVVVEMVNFIK